MYLFFSLNIYSQGKYLLRGKTKQQDWIKIPTERNAKVLSRYVLFGRVKKRKKHP